MKDYCKDIVVNIVKSSGSPVRWAWDMHTKQYYVQQQYEPEFNQMILNLISFYEESHEVPLEHEHHPK
jgi:hypothetical protein